MLIVSRRIVSLLAFTLLACGGASDGGCPDLVVLEQRAQCGPLSGCDPTEDPPPPTGSTTPNRLWLGVYNVSTISRDCSLSWHWVVNGQGYNAAIYMDPRSPVLAGTNRQSFVDVPPGTVVTVTGGCWKSGEPSVEAAYVTGAVAVVKHGCGARVEYYRPSPGVAGAEFIVSNC